MTESPTAAGLDLGTLALFAGQAAADELMREMRGRGFDDVRFSQGYVFEHLIDAEPTIGDLAERLDITQQGASKVVVELERAGYAVRVSDAVDARVRRVRLTRRGREVIEAYRAARRRQEERLAERYGAERVRQARELLAEVLEGLGGADAVRRRDARPPA